MIRYMVGNIFDTNCAGIVNPVNCVGAMGAGLALQFKNFYPQMFAEYRRRCRLDQVVIGGLDLHYLNNGQQVIINFPTKLHWRHPSKMEYLVAGLQTFVACYKHLGVDSVAFPLLGVGRGGLPENEVIALMEDYLSQCDIDIEIWKFGKVLDLSTLSPGNMEPLRKMVRENRDANGDASFMVTWKHYFLQTRLTFARHVDHVPDYTNSGWFDAYNGIFVRNYGGKQKNARHHRGGILATVMHEWCHRIQSFATSNGVGEWYWDLSHPRQEELYEKYYLPCEGYYAGSSAEEMAAEAFRVLSGCPTGEQWESNQYLLNDWRDFFMGDEVFRSMLVNK